MSAAALLKRLHDSNAKVDEEGGNLRIRAKSGTLTEEMLTELRASGTQRDMIKKMQTRQQLYDLLRYDDYTAQDRSVWERYGRD